MRHYNYVIVFSGLIILMLGVALSYAYRQTCRMIDEKCADAFDQAIAQDMDQRMREAGLSLSQKFVPDTSVKNAHFEVEDASGQTVHKKTEKHKSLREMEKLSMLKQSYLQKKNPVRVSVLDSLFRMELKKRNIVAPSCVTYTQSDRNESVSSGQTAFSNIYHSACMTERTIGIHEEIQLQGVAGISPGLILGEAPGLFLLPVAGLLALSVLLIYSVRKRQQRRKAHASAGVDVEEAPEQPVEQPVEQPILDRERFMVVFRGVSMQLSKMTFQLFEFIWESSNHYASYEDICSELYGKNGSIEQKKTRLKQLVKRLRDNMKGITFENLPQKGYRILCA